MTISERVQRLQRSLNDHGIELEPLAIEAAALFKEAGIAMYVRWLDLELRGYGTVVDQAPLHSALGVDPDERLAVHVSAYRSQQGRIVSPTTRYGESFRHFFVESIPELSHMARRLRDSTADDVQLEFGTSVPDYPASGAFSKNVFDRVLLGFRAVLHLQLGSIPR